MDSKSVVDLIEASSGVHFSGFHMDGLEQRHTEVEQPTTSATDSMHKQPFVIGKYWLETNVVSTCLDCSFYNLVTCIGNCPTPYEGIPRIYLTSWRTFSCLEFYLCLIYHNYPIGAG